VFILEGIPQPSIVYHIGSLRVPYTNVYLTYIGFILPLSISVVFLIIYLKEADRVGFIPCLILLLVMASLGVISYFVPSLQFIKTGIGSHASVIIFIIALLFLGYLIWTNKIEALLWLSYPLFFLVGVISDLDSLAVFKTVYFGGRFLYDGDFLYPLLFLALSTTIWCINNHKAPSFST
jgi:hypothetical protein